MEIYFCSGAEEVGRAATVLRIQGKNLLIDCGIKIGASQSEGLPDLRGIQETNGVDLILLTHAHLDHSGALPLISRAYPAARIYATHASKDLVRILLYDALKIQEMSEWEGELPLYSAKDVEDMLDRMICFPPEHPFSPPDLDCRVTFYQAGHILGAVSVLIESMNGESAFFSGDISFSRQLSVAQAFIPKITPGVAVLESTYGQSLHSSRDQEEKRMIQMILETIDNKGKVLIPAFALGRAQEIILAIIKAYNNHQIKELPVYIDGMVRSICPVYSNHTNYLSPNLKKRVEKGHDLFFNDWIKKISKKEEREKIVHGDPCVIISSSGMLRGGPSAFYAKNLIQFDNNCIGITGYQDEESPGKQLLNLLNETIASRELLIDGVKYPVKCKIEKYGLSAHADSGEMLGLARKLNAREIFLVHGEARSRDSLANLIQPQIKGKVYVPSNGEKFSPDIKKKRVKQMRHTLPSPMYCKDEPGDSELEKLCNHLLDYGEANFGYTTEELIYIYKGFVVKDENTQLEFRKLLNNSQYFKPFPRRPFLYMPVLKHEISGKIDSGLMEVNQTLAVMEEKFPAHTGLYKKGAYIEEKTIRLYFHFPDIAREKFRDLICSLEKETGWKIEINEKYHQNAVESVLRTLLKNEQCKIMGISHLFDSKECLLKLSGNIPSKEYLIERFKEETGIKLIIKIIISMNAVPGKLKPGTDERAEINFTFSQIDKAFAGEKIAPYKKSKITKDGESFIELSFLTPEIGGRYRNLLDVIERDFGWKIKIREQPDMNKLLTLAIQLLKDRGIVVIKNPSFIKNENKIVVILNTTLSENEIKELKEAFYDYTSYSLEFVYK